MNVSASLSVEKAAKLRREVLAPSLWVLAVLAWGVGDFTTTYIGYQTAFATEQTGFLHSLIVDHGHGAHAAFKAAYLLVAWIHYRRLPVVLSDPLDVEEDQLRGLLLAIPAAFALAGIWLTLVNLDVILSGGGVP